MLIQFSVSNFRSFRSRQTLSMVAVPRLGKRENVFVPDLNGEKFPPLLKVVAIYGPNASGKSSLIQAMDVFMTMTKPSRDVEKPLPAKPFRFDKDLEEKPSEFEIDFISERTRYYFALSFTNERVVREELISFPRGKETPLYKRTHTLEGEQYEFGEKFEGNEALREAWKGLTGPKQLFMTQVTSNSSEKHNQLRPPHTWLRSGLTTIDQDSLRRWTLATRTYVKRVPDQSDVIASFLREIDIPIARMTVNETEGVNNKFDSGADEIRAADKITKTTLTHSSNLGEADFDYSEESGGTKNLMGFWLPWITLAKGTDVLAVDELDSSLHPKIVESLVRKHLASSQPSQIIFTTHDTHLMNTKLIRRDQFWFTERDGSAATSLYSAYDFEGREGEDVEKRYFEGRYRALPILKGI
ncbi:ATPase [Pseudomonas sp. T]|nr:ATPase [Pseudomonas sp. T]